MELEHLHSRFDRFYIHEKSKDSPLASRITSVVPANKIQYVKAPPFQRPSGALSSEEFARSKKHVYVAPFEGQFFKRCPGAAPGLSCCNYFVLNWGLQCDMNCSYCYLQSFLNSPVMTIYSNLDDAILELRQLHSELGSQKVRIGTGETVDSLSTDDLTLFSHDLIDFFRSAPNWQLEFKTKSNKVEQFLDVEHSGNVVVSWSLNPQNIIEAEEHETASLSQRLQAAEKCRDKGFQISFHLDPIIWHPGWKESYSQLVQEITSRFEPSQFPHLSVGALRFQPEQRHMMRERFGMRSLVTRSEMHKSADGKLRYHQSVRNEMFQHLMQEFRKHSAGWKIFMCMESPETWLNVVGELPGKSEKLSPLFDPKPLNKARSFSLNSQIKNL